MTHITIERAKLEQGLAALKRMKRFGDTFGYRAAEQNPYEQVCEAADVLEQALAAPVQEPLLYINPKVIDPATGKVRNGAGALTFSDSPCAGWSLPLYTTPPAAPVQEPVEGYPSDWAKVTLMVSPKGEMHAIAGDRETGDGDEPYIGLERIKAASPAAQPAVPEGWKLVPVEPTEEMLAAADEGDREYTLRNFGDVQTVMQGPYDHYAAMLAAAPEAPAAQPAQEEIQRLSALVRAQQITIDKLEAQASEQKGAA